jgi:pSer/pThr/pTyr-binding forkhead associated (FHA) protein
MQLSTLPLKQLVLSSIERIREQNSDFQDAYETYVQQYGKEKITVSEPLNLADTIDPAALIFAKNCTILYLDYSKTLKGSLGSVNLKMGEVYVFGRRQPQDSKLVVWSTAQGPVEIETYNARISTIVSRVHAAIAFPSEREVLFMDLGSSSGSVLVGESVKKGAFVRIYDPGTEKAPSIKFERIFAPAKNAVT